jgi:hypothetical protein
MFLSCILQLYAVLYYIRLTKGYTINQGDIRPKVAMQTQEVVVGLPPVDVSVSFSHIQLYVDEVEDISVYKLLEDQLNLYGTALATRNAILSLEEKRQLWKSLLPMKILDCSEPAFSSHHRDVVKQLIAGLGFRTAGYACNGSTRSVLVSSRDPDGVQILVTAANHCVTTPVEPPIRGAVSASGIFDACEYTVII